MQGLTYSYVPVSRTPYWSFGWRWPRNLRRHVGLPRTCWRAAGCHSGRAAVVTGSDNLWPTSFFRRFWDQATMCTGLMGLGRAPQGCLKKCKRHYRCPWIGQSLGTDQIWLQSGAPSFNFGWCWSWNQSGHMGPPKTCPSCCGPCLGYVMVLAGSDNLWVKILVRLQSMKF